MRVSDTSVNIDLLTNVMKCFIEDLEDRLNWELVITSGYRGVDHPIEAIKKSPGEHTTGQAIDVACDAPWKFLELVREATSLGCNRIGISRKNGFVHIGLDKSRPTSIWVY